MAKFKSAITNFKKVKETIIEEKTKEKEGSSYENSLMFKPKMVQGEDETEFKIRFLPMEESSTGKPWIQIDYHMFERPGDKKFIKVIDPRTFDKKAQNPITEYASKLWKSENPVDKEQAKKLFKKARYFTFVYVKEAPSNQKHYEGKVLIFEIGQKIYETLENSIKKYEKCFWDAYKGQDFLLVIKPRGEWPDYSASNWIGDSGPIVEDEADLDKIYDNLQKLSIKTEIIEKDGIRSGMELEELLNGGLKAAALNESSPKDLSPKNTAEKVEKPKQSASSKPANKPDFGTDNVSVKSVVKDEPKESTETKTEEEEINIDDLDMNFSDDDFK